MFNSCVYTCKAPVCKTYVKKRSTGKQFLSWLWCGCHGNRLVSFKIIFCFQPVVKQLLAFNKLASFWFLIQQNSLKTKQFKNKTCNDRKWKNLCLDKRGLETNLNPNSLKVRLKVSYGRLKVRFPSVIFWTYLAWLTNVKRN